MWHSLEGEPKTKGKNRGNKEQGHWGGSGGFWGKGGEGKESGGDLREVGAKGEGEGLG